MVMCFNALFKNKTNKIMNPAMVKRHPPSNIGGTCSIEMRYFPVGKEDPIHMVVKIIHI